MKEGEFVVELVETKVTRKLITLKRASDIKSTEEAEIYVKGAMDDLGFDGVGRFPSVLDEYELTYNGKPDWEVGEEGL